MNKEDFSESLKNLLEIYSVAHINDHHETTCYSKNGDYEALSDAIFNGGVSTLELVKDTCFVGDVTVRVKEDVELSERVVDFYTNTQRETFLVHTFFYPFAS